MVTVNQVLRVIKSILSNFSSRSRLIRHLERQQNLTQSQDEWMDLAERIDNVQGNDVWRSDPNCPLYERERIAARIDEFVHLMRRRDIFELVSRCIHVPVQYDLLPGHQCDHVRILTIFSVDVRLAWRNCAQHVWSVA